MPDYLEIYATQAQQYEKLIGFEDVKGNILKALSQLRPPNGLDLVDLGAGTGRLSRLFAPHAKSILALDASAAMLRVATAKLSRLAPGRWGTAVADHRALPLPDHSADLVTAGWTLGHFPSWYPHTWQQEIGRALAEMRRIAKPDGTLIILETLGTGFETPRPPTAELAAYYAWLENEHHFAPSWIRTDYRFASAAEAEALIRFFFGEELAGRVAAEQLIVLPECTGIWRRSNREP